jgi:Putative MetA-pathway of phenol degradation
MNKVLVGCIVGFVVLLAAQPSSARTLAELIPGLYGGNGITLATDPAASHEAHFTVASRASINRFNEQIANQIGNLPFSSSVSGFLFTFDPALGTFIPAVQDTLGPLFAERAPTLGSGKLNLNFSYTFFKYNTFAGQNLDNFTILARHDPDIIGLPDVPEQFEFDTIRINLNINMRVQIFSFAATYGLTDRLDVGLFIPITSVNMTVHSHASIVASSDNTLFPNVHRFDAQHPSDDTASGYAFGLGDIILRAKYNLLKGDVIDLSGALLTKFATGSHSDFLGTGTTTIRPFLVLSRTLFNMLTPHLNLGYEFNLGRGSQSALEYVVGFDVGTAKFTVVADLLGSYEPAGDGIGDNILTGSLGVKWNPWKQLVVSANAQVPFNRKSGLRSDLILTFGAEYSF